MLLSLVRRSSPGLIAVLGACSAETASTTGTTSPLDSVDPNVVAIASPNGDPTFVCSAEVIAPRVVLSAAHCFRGGNYDKTGWTFEIIVGHDVHAASARHVPVTLFRVHPDYETAVVRADGSDADIAVAFVGDDLAVPALAVNLSPLPASLVGQSGRYVGFGADEVAAKGTRHSEPAEVLTLLPDVVELTSSRIPCHGDSGGPLLVTLEGRETIIGVGHTAQGDDAGHCTTSATYTRTDLFVDFVRSAL